MKTIYIHVGYHKVSSTFLQRNFFPYLKDIDYLGTYYKQSKDFSLSNIINFKLYSSEVKKYGIISKFAYEIGVAPSINLKRKTINDFLKKIDNSKSDKILISSEDFLRPFFYNEMSFYLSDILSNYNIEIIMITREQKSIIQSRYSHDLKTIKEKYTLKSALTNIYDNRLCYYPICKHLEQNVECICEKNKNKNINLEFYNYNMVFDTFSKYFSKVNVIPYESLYNTDSGLYNILKVMDTEFMNGKLSDIYNQKENHRSKDEKLNVFLENKELLEQLGKYYEDSNKELDNKLSNLELKKYKYY